MSEKVEPSELIIVGECDGELVYRKLSDFPAAEQAMYRMQAETRNKIAASLNETKRAVVAKFLKERANDPNTDG